MQKIRKLTSLRELGAFIVIFKSYPASFIMYPRHGTDVSCQPVVYATCQKSPQTMRQLHHPWARNHGGLKVKEACSLDPGKRFLTCLCPNTRQSSVTERHTLLWGRSGGWGRALMWEKTRECVYMCVCVREHPCVFGWVRGGIAAVHRKETTALETPTQHLPSNRIAPNSSPRVSLQGSGDPKTQQSTHSPDTQP